MRVALAIAFTLFAEIANLAASPVVATEASHAVAKVSAILATIINHSLITFMLVSERSNHPIPIMSL